MLPLVCNDAVAILFMFDLTRKSTLNSIKEWYRQARGFNKVRKPIRHSPTSTLTRLIIFVDRNPILGRHKVRPLRELHAGGAGGDLKTSPEVCACHEGELDLQQYEPQHKRTEG